MAYFSIFFLFFLFTFNNQIICSEIKLNVNNIGNPLGSIHVALYNNPDMFPKSDGKFLGLKKKARKVIEEGILIEGLNMGKYAIAIYHDKNDNDEFDTFFGLPAEKYGFSKNAKVFFGPPKFSEASFFLSENVNLKLDIDLK